MIGKPPDFTTASINGRGAKAAFRSLMMLVASVRVSAGIAIRGRIWNLLIVVLLIK
jgi:hypothetical protein